MSQRQLHDLIKDFYQKIKAAQLLFEEYSEGDSLKNEQGVALQDLQNAARHLKKTGYNADLSIMDFIEKISADKFNVLGERESLIADIGQLKPEMVNVPSATTLPVELIDDFQTNSGRKRPDADVVNEYLGGESSDPVKLLHKGTKDVKTDRLKYLAHLQKIMDDDNKNFHDEKTNNPIDNMTTLKNFLGKDGVKLYYAALAEEQNSKAFRNAVFVRAVNHYPGDEWEDQMVLWVAGPSASGKTRGAAAAIQEAGSKIMRKKANTNTGNLVVSVDGEIERETSQIRQLTLKVSDIKGYPGISGLDPSESSIKSKIKQTALKHLIEVVACKTENLQRKLHLVIPNTFTNPLTKFKLRSYSKRDKTTQIFSEVVPADGREDSFQSTTERAGNNRALKIDYGTPKPGTPIIMNDFKIKHASKPYRPEYFTKGQDESRKAHEYYRTIANGQHYLRIINDSVFYKRIKDNPEEWSECTRDDIDTIDTIELLRMAKRDYDEWHRYYNPPKKNNTAPIENKKGLREWYQEKDNEKQTAAILVEIPALTDSMIEEHTLEQKIDYFLKILEEFENTSSGLRNFDNTPKSIETAAKKRHEFDKVLEALHTQYTEMLKEPVTVKTDETTNKKRQLFFEEFDRIQKKWLAIKTTPAPTIPDAGSVIETAKIIEVPAQKPVSNPAPKSIISDHEMELIREKFEEMKLLLQKINQMLDPFLAQVEQRAAKKQPLKTRDVNDNVTVSDKHATLHHHEKQIDSRSQTKHRADESKYKRGRGQENR